MTSDTILASGLREGDVIKVQGRPDSIVMAVVNTGTHMLVTVQSIRNYQINAPVRVDRLEFHNQGASR